MSRFLIVAAVAFAALPAFAGAPAIPEVDSLEVVAVVDNFYDCFQKEEKCAKRWNLASADSFDTIRLQGEMGLAYYITATVKGKQHIILIFDFFNLFNLGAPQRPNGNGYPLQQSNIASYGQVIGRQTPFRFQLGLRYVY